MQAMLSTTGIGCLIACIGCLGGGVAAICASCGICKVQKRSVGPVGTQMTATAQPVVTATVVAQPAP